jgi:hypothetical protein
MKVPVWGQVPGLRVRTLASFKSPAKISGVGVAVIFHIVSFFSQFEHGFKLLKRRYLSTVFGFW